MRESIEWMMDKVVLITGATGGIGKAAAMALAGQGFTVVVHGRHAHKTAFVVEEIKKASGNEKIDMLVADLFSLKEVRQLAVAFKQRYHKLDVLINNAGGIMGRQREVTTDGVEKTIAVNLLAPFLLTELLLEVLKNSEDARIINVASNAHRINANPDFTTLDLKCGYNPLRAYGNAKLFLIWVTQHLAEVLRQRGAENITVNALHPGSVATNFGVESNLGFAVNLLAKLIRPLFITPEQGAENTIYLATHAAVKGLSGLYFDKKKPAKVGRKYYSPYNEEVVWNFCLEKTRPFTL